MGRAGRPKLHLACLAAYYSPVYTPISGDARGGQIIDVQILPIQVRSDIAGHLAPFQFIKISGNHPAMDFLAALGIDGVRNISV